jgi:RNA polymerase sigma factor (sigma-70 family)
VEERFRQLLFATGPALLRLAGSYTRSPSDRDDLFQEIALAIWKALPSFRGDSSERTFLFRIAHNRAISQIAKRKGYVGSDELEDVPDRKPDPETSLTSVQLHALLVQAIQRLPIAYRQVITLTLEGMNYTEIAYVTGISESNVGVRLNRARNLLRQSLEVNYEQR